jgi:hypothetical protein
MDFLVEKFRHFEKKCSGKIPLLKLKKQQRRTKNNKNCHNCLQYERVFKIIYFHILDIAKFG